MYRSKRSVKKPIVDETSSEDEGPATKIKKTKTTKQIKTIENSSSESDIESYLQPINKIDLSSSFFSLPKKSDDFSNENKPESCCLSSSSDSSLDKNEILSVANNKIEVSEQQSTNDTFKMGFQQMDEFKRKMEETKKQIEQYNEKRKSQNVQSKKEKDKPILDLDICDLLALGETKKQLNLENIKREDLHSSDFEPSGDEWEEVKIKEYQEDKHHIEKSVPKEGIQIVVDTLPNNAKKKKAVDFLAAMKRRLNRIRKENQVYVHKVHLLCWIAHGNYVNMIMNNSEILSQALTLLPSEKSYPSDRIDLSYLEKIVQWYKKTITVTDKPIPKKLDLMSCLQLQIAKKKAFNNKMNVLIFITILRALSIQTRLLLSFQVEPLRPPASELHSLAKDDLEKNKGSNMNKKYKETVKDKVIDKKTASTSVSNQEVDLVSKKSNLAPKKKLISKKEKKSIPEDKQKKVSGNEVTNKPNSNVKKRESSTVVINNEKERKKENLKTDSSNSVKSTKTKQISKGEAFKIISSTSDNKTPKKRTTRNQSEASDNKLPRLEERRRSKRNIPQVDGLYDSSESSCEDEITYSQLLLQLDGPSDVKEPKKKKLLQKLKSNSMDTNKSSLKEKKTSNVSRPSLSRLKPHKTNSDEVDDSLTQDSEDEFVSSSNNRKISKKKLDLQNVPRRQLDVKNDIMNLIKGRIAEQKHVDRSRMVKKHKKTYVDSDSDSDYAPEPVPKKHHSDSDNDCFVPKTKVKKRIRVKKEGNALKVISSESDLDESGKKKRKGVNVWVEVFLEAEETWICVDVVKGQVHCVNEIYARATHPITYIVAWKNDNTLKDVTKRYCKNFSTTTRKLRVDHKWWEESLKPFVGPQTIRDKEEDDDLNRQQLDQPMPKVISEYKNHPLYALKRHLLKFEAIYPDDQIPMGYVRGEAVYPRNSVYVCKSRDIWLKEALVVKPGEKPYKIVKARPKYDKLSNTVITDQMLEIFGPWQTMDYEPPTAENGVVPRNAFGNVELFKPCMLPKGTVHIRLSGLNKVCRKLNVDCASAIVGFDFHGGWSHPVYDGFVVCEEFADKVIAAWELDQEEMERKENEKIEQRVYGNWKKLIKGLLIRERLKAKYAFGEPPSSQSSSKTKDSKKSRTSKKKRKSSSSGDEWDDME